jgi:hypothetical protein
LPEKVIFQILGSLLGQDQQVPTDSTLEAALNFIVKVGHALEERIAKKESSAGKTA